MKGILKGFALKSIKKCKIVGEALVAKEPITWLGFVNQKTGKVNQKGHELDGKNIKGKILIYPMGIGSTVAPYVLINLKKNKVAPKAIINKESDQGTVSGTSIAGIPLIYRVDRDPTEVIKDGDIVTIHIENGLGIVKVNK